MKQTPYYRSWRPQYLIGWLFEQAFPRQLTYRPFLQRGYAIVVADLRGAGASFGQRDTVFSQAEMPSWIGFVGNPGPINGVAV